MAIINSFIFNSYCSTDMKLPLFNQVDYLIRYTIASIGAVLTEFLLFLAIINFTSYGIWSANVISAILGVILSWNISGHTLFKKNNITMSGYITWVAYLFFVIPLFSFCVQYLGKLLNSGLVAKILVTVLSFTINSFFFKKVILNNN